MARARISSSTTVGGSVFAECVRALAFQGRLATVGYLDGVLKAEMDIEALHAKAPGAVRSFQQAAQRRTARRIGARLRRRHPSGKSPTAASGH